MVAAWLCAVILNLLVAGDFFDIALRDFGLSLGALVLARLAEAVGSGHAQAPATAVPAARRP